MRPAVASTASPMDAAAFGHDPGRWPLPRVTEPVTRWHRAVVLGGQGRYSLAVAELDDLDRRVPSGHVVRSLSQSTRASFLRQMGGHDRAARYDGDALARVGSREPAESLAVLEARCDAVTGLAADALGCGRFELSSALLDTCAIALTDCPNEWNSWRPRLRLRWVQAELAMVTGNGSLAVRHALDAQELAIDIVSLRHRTKSDLIAAAAFSSTGDLGRARELAYSVLETCSKHGLMPLRWATAMLLVGLGEVTTAQPIVVECVAFLQRQGGVPSAG